MDTSSPAETASSIGARFDAARRAIERACRIAGRESSGVTLTAVTKTQGPAAVDAALAWGQRVFGENRVQEAQGRWTPERRAAEGLELRLIGPLQSNKADDAVALFDVIETVDRDRIVHALAEAGARAGRTVRVLIQVNTGAEAQKAGVHPKDADALAALARGAGLQVEGLMCIPPAEEEPGPHFALLRKIAARNGLSVLSMGMSGDFDTAIRFGATHVRLGTALFGAR